MYATLGFLIILIHCANSNASHYKNLLVEGKQCSSAKEEKKKPFPAKVLNLGILRNYNSHITQTFTIRQRCQQIKLKKRKHLQEMVLGEQDVQMQKNEIRPVNITLHKTCS